MNLNERYTAGKVVIFEEDAKAGVLKVRFPFALADTQNKNGRTYSLSVLENAVNKINEKIKDGESIYCFTGHPQDPFGSLKDVSHIIDKLGVVKGVAWGTAKILTDSAHGKILKTILKAGGAIGSSMRGTGNVKNGLVENFTLHGIDYVINPSFGKDVNFNKSAIIEKTKHTPDSAALTEKLYSEAIDAGFPGSLEEFKKMRSALPVTEKEREKEQNLLDEKSLAGVEN